MARNLKTVKNETQTLYDLDHAEKHSKTWKYEKHTFRTWNMAKKLKNIENETETQYDLEHGKKH